MNKQSRALRWGNTYSISELLALRKQIEDEHPVTAQRYDGIYSYHRAVRAKFADIDQAIQWHMDDQKKARGEEISYGEAYTGRKQNRR